MTANIGSAFLLLARIIPLLGLVLSPGLVRAACVVDDKANVALTVSGMRAITVPVEVNDIEATFILDTGAQRSVVTQEAVQRLGLVRDKWVGTTMAGVGGIERRPNADPRRKAEDHGEHGQEGQHLAHPKASDSQRLRAMGCG